MGKCCLISAFFQPQLDSLPAMTLALPSSIGLPSQIESNIMRKFTLHGPREVIKKISVLKNRLSIIARCYIRHHFLAEISGLRMETGKLLVAGKTVRSASTWTSTKGYFFIEFGISNEKVEFSEIAKKVVSIALASKLAIRILILSG